MLRVTVSCHATFHSFQLAREMARRGALERLLSGDPRAMLDREIPFGRAWNLPLATAIGRMPSLFPRLAPRIPWERARQELHGRWAALAMGDPDVVVAWSGAARRMLTVAHDRGIVGIVERGSGHIAHQDRVLREEADRFGAVDGVDSEGIAIEMAEYALADRIMVPSKYARRTFIERGIPAEKVLQVPYGADISMFKPGTKHDDVFRVIFVGNLSLQKGVYYLLEAFKRLRLPRSELVLVGPTSPEMEPILKPYEGVYRRTGPISKRAIAELLQQGSVYVHPSLQEGLSLALREALGAGLPVVATPESGAEDAMEHGREGFVVPSRDIDAISERLEQLYREPLLRDEMARQAAAHARAWTWTEYGQAVYEAYEGAVAAVVGSRR